LTKSLKGNGELLMNLTEKILEDYLRHTYHVKDPRILSAVKRVLSAREQGSLELHATVVTGKKLVVICDHPERIKEVILMEKTGPGRVYRQRLALKCKKNPAEA